MKDYNTLLSERERINREVKVCEASIQAGIPKSKAHCILALLDRVRIRSGYSMGEVIVVNVKGFEVMRIDQTEEYARSCQWRAKHGEVILDMTLKQAKEVYNALDILDRVHYDLGVKASNYGDFDEATIKVREKYMTKRSELVELVKSLKVTGEIKKLYIG